MCADFVLQAGETGQICYKYIQYLAQCLLRTQHMLNTYFLMKKLIFVIKIEIKYLHTPKTSQKNDKSQSLLCMLFSLMRQCYYLSQRFVDWFKCPQQANILSVYTSMCMPLASLLEISHLQVLGRVTVKAENWQKGLRPTCRKRSPRIKQGLQT